MMATASAPSPIYPLYRERWGFSVTMLTVVFAVYVAGLLGALLTVGSLSDHLGRRPVPVAALLVAAASTAIFWAADGVGSLLIARVAQGLATGTATDALAAGLVEFAPGERPHLRRGGRRAARSGEHASRRECVPPLDTGVREPRRGCPRDP
jgi:MFS family permease